MNTAIAKLGKLSIDVTNKRLMEFVLKSFPPRFDHFQLTYSIQKHKWSLEDLTSLWAQEELWLNEVNFESPNFASTYKSEKRKDCLHCRKPISEEKYVFTGIDTSARVDGFITFRLLLNTGHFVYLIDTFVVPTFRCNLVSVSTLDKFWFYLYEDNIIGTGSLLQDSNLYCYSIQLNFLDTSMRGMKLKSLSSNTYSLWYKRLNHIS